MYKNPSTEGQSSTNTLSNLHGSSSKLIDDAEMSPLIQNLKTKRNLGYIPRNESTLFEEVYSEQPSEATPYTSTLNEVKILIIYTGGTIGMKKSDTGYIPVKGFLAEQVGQLSQFHDPQFPRKDLLNDWFVTPVSPQGVRARFIIKEYDPLMDSSNMSFQDWCKIATDIEEHYADFDAFIVLHGTDTMAYTTSALSFMLQNLGKTVIFTGSQIPISRARNDGFDNLLGALTIAMHYEIPEVTLYFDDVLLRGNRASKVDCTSLHAFSSNNYPPLVEVGIDINVNWNLIRRPPASDKKLHVKKIRPVNVGTCVLYPGIPDSIIENYLKEPTQGVILQTYGTGNAPDNRPNFLRILKEANDRGVIIVNCTQCAKGRVTQGEYQTGFKLTQCGVVSGSDMTTEAALCKLMYLLSHEEMPIKEVKRMMQANLRGELTIATKDKNKFSLREKQFVHAVARTLLGYPSQEEVTSIQHALYPTLLCHMCAQGDLDEVKALIREGCDVNSKTFDQRTALHVAVCENHFEIVKYLIEEAGASVDIKDRWGLTPYDEAKSFGFENIAIYLQQHNAVASPLSEMTNMHISPKFRRAQLG